MSSLPFSDTPEHGPIIGAFRNEWRRRHVMIYAHPTNELLVITCGRSLQAPPLADVWTVEARALYARYIGTYHKVSR